MEVVFVVVFLRAQPTSRFLFPRRLYGSAWFLRYEKLIPAFPGKNDRILPSCFLHTLTSWRNFALFSQPTSQTSFISRFMAVSPNPWKFSEFLSFFPISAEHSPSRQTAIFCDVSPLHRDFRSFLCSSFSSFSFHYHGDERRRLRGGECFLSVLGSCMKKKRRAPANIIMSERHDHIGPFIGRRTFSVGQ